MGQTGAVPLKVEKIAFKQQIGLILANLFPENASNHICCPKTN